MDKIQLKDEPRLTVKKLKRKIPGDAQIKEIVNQHLQAIEDRIIDTAKNFQSFTIYELPYNISVAGLSLLQSQKLVYYKIMKQLEKGNFNVKLKLVLKDNGKKASHLHISWNICDDFYEFGEVDDYLSKHRI